MDEQKPRRWRRWLIFAGSSLVCLFALILIVAQVLLVSNQIPQEKLTPPPDLLRLTKPAKIAANSNQKLVKPDRQTADTTAGESVRPKPRADWVSRYHAYQSNDPWPEAWARWSLGEPFSAEQKKWLEAHRAMFDDLFRAGAAEEDFGAVSCEAAAAMNDDELVKLANGPFYMNMTLFRLEYARRRAAGDLMGAADVLCMLGKFAQSRKEPFLHTYYYSQIHRYTRNRILMGWLREEPMPPDVARRMENAILAEDFSAPDFRRPLELEYRTRREAELRKLNRPLRQVFREDYNGFDNRYRELSMWNVIDDIQAKPVKTFQNITGSAITSVIYKSSVTSALEAFDARWSRYLKSWDKLPKGELPKDIDELVSYGLRDSLDYYVRLDQAMESVILSALDRMIKPGGEKYEVRMDPYRNQPLTAIEEGSTTLITSAGPDKTDQQGRVTYDPTNGTNSSGDIVLRLGK